MVNQQLTEAAKHTAIKNGADLVGMVNANFVPENAEDISRILPEAGSIVVVASKHSLAALRSSNVQMGQFDTVHTYRACARAAHEVSRFLESKGFSSVAVPAFIPIDMAEPKKGMRAEICWRSAGVKAGLGSYGENGLLVTKECGSAIRISGLLTLADLNADPPLDEDVCDHCSRCVDACPVNALGGKGRLNKKKCGDEIFKYGFRHFAGFMQDLIQKPKSEMIEIIKGHGLREMWQTFMTGNYYYCFQCQSQCPATKMPQTDR
jgi:epoxyqueuosine reductase QueG